MVEDIRKLEIIDPKSQLNLYDFNDYFMHFVSIFRAGKLPNVILLSGPKGTGKATFAFHFINFILSNGEDNNYSLDKFEINKKNKSFNLIQNNIHSNFFLLKNISSDDSIKIDQVRDLLVFLGKSTYNKNIKIVLIDNAEYLNINSSNALLKSLEESQKDTFFFIIHDSNKKILETIKSRSLQFKFHFTLTEKMNIFKEISRDYDLNINDDSIKKYLEFLSPGIFLKFLLILNEFETDDEINNLSNIKFLMEKYKKKKELELLRLISLLIESLFNDLSIKNPNSVNFYFYNKHKISNLINNNLKFNLDKNNLLLSIDEILNHATQ